MPGLRTTSVRRTVIVAVSLVIGQALLGAVIGFVTFDRGDEAPVAARPTDALAAPPIVVPAPSIPVPTGSQRPPRKRAAAEVSTSIRRTPTPDPASTGTTEATTSPRTTAPPRPTTSAPATVPPSSAPPPAPPSFPSLLPPEYDAPPDDVPVIRERCDEEGATGRTDDGTVVRCERDRDGDLRWRPV